MITAVNRSTGLRHVEKLAPTHWNQAVSEWFQKFCYLPRSVRTRQPTEYLKDPAIMASKLHTTLATQAVLRMKYTISILNAVSPGRHRVQYRNGEVQNEMGKFKRHNEWRRDLWDSHHLRSYGSKKLKHIMNHNAEEQNCAHSSLLKSPSVLWELSRTAHRISTSATVFQRLSCSCPIAIE